MASLSLLEKKWHERTSTIQISDEDGVVDIHFQAGQKKKPWQRLNGFQIYGQGQLVHSQGVGGYKLRAVITTSHRRSL